MHVHHRIQLHHLHVASRSQSMPKLNPKNSSRRSQSPLTTPTIEHYFQQQQQQQHPSSRSSSPKSFSVNSDHGFGSECASHLSSGKIFLIVFLF